MKKFVLAVSLAVSAATASAVDFVSIDVDHVKDSKSRAQSTAQYVRAGTTWEGLNLGLQVRTAVAHSGGLTNSIEGTVGQKIGPINFFTGVGHDNGINGARNGSYQYGLVGGTVGTNLGAAYAFSGLKSRVNWDNSAPEQTLAFAGVSYPLAKGLSVTANLSKSYRDIKENAVGLGVRISF